MFYKKWLVFSGWWLVVLAAVCSAETEKFNLSPKQQVVFKEAEQFVQGLQSVPTVARCPLQTSFLPISKRQPLTTSHPPLIFVSFSIGEEAIKQYIHEANKTGAALVLRGLLQNSIKVTALRTQKLIEGTKAGFLIDPNLFRRFGIEKVPAVVIADPNKTSFDVIYGLTTLDYALEKISQSGELPGIAKEALLRLRGKQ